MTPSEREKAADRLEALEDDPSSERMFKSFAKALRTYNADADAR